MVHHLILCLELFSFFLFRFIMECSLSITKWDCKQMFWVKGATERERIRDTGTWFVLCCLVRWPKPVALCVFSLFLSFFFEWQMHNLYTQMHTYLNTQLRNLITCPSVSVVFFNALNHLPISPCLTLILRQWLSLEWIFHD